MKLLILELRNLLMKVIKISPKLWMKKLPIAEEEVEIPKYFKK